jgi:hypothetical protein
MVRHHSEERLVESETLSSIEEKQSLLIREPQILDRRQRQRNESPLVEASPSDARGRESS